MRNTKVFLLICIFFLCTQLSLYSQGRYGEALSDNSIVSVGSKKGYLYTGIDNYVRIDSSLYSNCQDIQLVSTNGIALKDTNDMYLIIPEKSGKVRLSMLCCNECDTLLRGYKYFHSQNVPEPQLTLDANPIATPLVISKEVLLSCDSLGVYFSNDLIGSSNWLTITEFLLGYKYGGFYVSHKNLSNKLSEETKGIISKLGPENDISIRTTVVSAGKIRKQLPIYRIRIY